MYRKMKIYAYVCAIMIAVFLLVAFHLHATTVVEKKQNDKLIEDLKKNYKDETPQNYSQQSPTGNASPETVDSKPQNTVDYSSGIYPSSAKNNEQDPGNNQNYNGQQSYQNSESPNNTKADEIKLSGNNIAQGYKLYKTFDVGSDKFAIVSSLDNRYQNSNSNYVNRQFYVYAISNDKLYPRYYLFEHSEQMNDKNNFTVTKSGYDTILKYANNSGLARRISNNILKTNSNQYSNMSVLSLEKVSQSNTNKPENK